METYREILQIAGQLATGKATERRRAADKLSSLLRNALNQYKLAQEAAPQEGISVQASRVQAISNVYRAVIQAIVASIEAFTTGSAKIQREDIENLKIFVVICDEKDVGVIYPEPEWVEPKLGKKEMKKVIKCCLELLGNERALEVAELGLMDLLAHLCSRKHYVACMNHDTINVILNDVKKRIFDNDDDVGNASALVLKKLWQTMTDLDAPTGSWLAWTLKLVRTWINHVIRLKDVINKSKLDRLLSIAAIAVRDNLSQAVGQLSLPANHDIFNTVRRFINKGFFDKTMIGAESYLLAFL